MTLSFVMGAACGKDLRDPQVESPDAARTDTAAFHSETTMALPTATSSESTLAQGSGRRSGAGGSRGDSSAARPSARPPATASSSPPPPPTPSTSPSEGRVVELRGTITVVGNAPVTQVQLQGGSGGNRTLTGPELQSLRRVAGLEVRLSGTIAPGGELSVRDFTVLSADGQPALDGVLEHEGNTVHLRTASGRVPLGNPPADFYTMPGARVWLTGSPDRGPNSFGIITPAR